MAIRFWYTAHSLLSRGCGQSHSARPDLTACVSRLGSMHLIADVLHHTQDNRQV